VVSAGKYQRHIDGLRAVAVLAVLLFHLEIPGFAGGYAGVDVFLVISGYLISRKIVEEVEATGRFRFGKFYMARVRRLFPALFATLMLSMAAAAILLPTPAAQRMGWESLAALGSVSNILFWLQSGYFDAASETKPLLHTWTLGVEEQFYLVWPIIIVLLAAFSGARRLWAGLALIGLISLVANLYVVAAKPEWLYEPLSALFFLTPFRVYEFVVGAMGVWLVRLMPTHRLLNEAAMVLGLALIAVTVIALPPDVPWPSWWALIPCTGALLVILAPGASFAGAVVTNKISVGIGLISYSLYLVHWPLIVFYRAITFQEPGPLAAAGLVVMSIALAALSYRYVEQPARRPSAWVFPLRRFATGAIIGAVVASSFAGALAAGMLGRTAKLTAEQIETGKRNRFILTKSGCRIEDLDTSERCHMDRPLQVLFLGNSHEPDAYNSFAALYGDSDEVNLISFGTVNRCELTLDETGLHSSIEASNCATRAAALNDPATLKRIDVVVLSLNIAFDERGAEGWKLLEWMRERNPNLKLVVMGGYLNLSADCPDLYNRFESFEACRAPEVVTEANFNERNGTQEGRSPQADRLTYLHIDEMALMCPDKTLASCAVEADGEPFTYDRHHRSLAFSRLIAKRMAETYGAELEALGFPSEDQTGRQ
jgi:peptidoglycan/LPS O-acetylase OafA/YrhL